jgi:hypothetical protein
MERKPWEQTAIEIGEEAAQEHGNNIDEAMDYIHESVDGNEHVIITKKAWETVFDARFNNTSILDIYYMAYADLIDTEGDKLQASENLDDVISRLAYWIMYNRASMAYEAMFEEIETEEAMFEKTEGGNKK